MKFVRLPNELLLKIGYVCTVKSILSLRSVNHHFHDVFSDIFYGKFAIPASKVLDVPCSTNPATNATQHLFHDIDIIPDIFYWKFIIPAPNVLDVARSTNPATNAIQRHWTSVPKRLLERGVDANIVVSHPLESKCLLLDIAGFQHRYLNATSKEDTEIV
jgi:hypothetical protein